VNVSNSLKLGDRIVAVAQADGKPAVDIVDLPLAQAVGLIRGAKGSTVQPTIIPAGADQSVRRTVSFVRDEIKLEDQQAKARIFEFPAADGQTRRLGVMICRHSIPAEIIAGEKAKPPRPKISPAWCAN
jgi:carboxyl-terminal processing protease